LKTIGNIYKNSTRAGKYLNILICRSQSTFKEEKGKNKRETEGKKFLNKKLFAREVLG